jgi:integrase
MRPLFVIVLIGLSFASSGCSLFVDAGRNLSVSAARNIERKREWHRNYQWAERALAECCAADGATVRSKDYATGFKDGYAEYLFRGGNGEPPLVAPQRYRLLSYQTPQGYQAIGDWFAGYRRGAAAAKASGAREWITGPSSLLIGHAGAAPPSAPGGLNEALPGEPPKPPQPELPPPRLAPDAAPPKRSAAPSRPGPVVVTHDVTGDPVPEEDSPDAPSKLPPVDPDP